MCHVSFPGSEKSSHVFITDQTFWPLIHPTMWSRFQVKEPNMHTFQPCIPVHPSQALYTLYTPGLESRFCHPLSLPQRPLLPPCLPADQIRPVGPHGGVPQGSIPHQLENHWHAQHGRDSHLAWLSWQRYGHCQCWCGSGQGGGETFRRSVSAGIHQSQGYNGKLIPCKNLHA